MLEIEEGLTRCHSVQNSLWRRLWVCRRTDYVVMIVLMMMMTTTTKMMSIILKTYEEISCYTHSHTHTHTTVTFCRCN